MAASPRTGKPRTQAQPRGQKEVHAPGANGAGPEPPTSVPEQDEAWIADRSGAVINTAFVASALGVARRPPLRAGVKVAAALLRRPQLVAKPLRNLVGEAAKIATGRSELAPWSTDRRYDDPSWRTNPLARALAQGHLASVQALDDYLGQVELDEGTDYRVRLAVTNIAEALAPPNFPLLNPAALKKVLDTGGQNLLVGAGRFIEDMREPPRVPARADGSGFTLGVDVAATPGAVVQRTPVFELIQYESSTPQVQDRPLLIVPSVVNKFYLTDLSQGRSLAEHAVESGYQTFSLSWVNPDKTHRDFGLDTYIGAIADALETVAAISGSPSTHVVGVCAGGQLASIAAAYLAGTGRDLVATLTLLVCVMDHADEAAPTGLLSREAAELAIRPIERRGFVDGRKLAATLAWLRPVDSVWWPWVHRYLLAAEMPRLDLFHWSEDTTNLSARLVRDTLELTLDNALVRPGTLVVLGEPIDLGKVQADAYLIAGLTDHLTPWQACYRATQMLGSTCRFILVTGGHIQAILQPPGRRSVGYRTAPETPADPVGWLKRASFHDDSWWSDWTHWLDERSNGRRPAPERLGDSVRPALDPAPGLYVRRRLDAG
jgi:polyhydroxyalkanoate synthase